MYPGLDRLLQEHDQSDGIAIGYLLSEMGVTNDCQLMITQTSTLHPSKFI